MSKNIRTLHLPVILPDSKSNHTTHDTCMAGDSLSSLSLLVVNGKNVTDVYSEGAQQSKPLIHNIGVG